jgi:hypothetical protein
MIEVFGNSGKWYPRFVPMALWKCSQVTEMILWIRSCRRWSYWRDITQGYWDMCSSTEPMCIGPRCVTGCYRSSCYRMLRAIKTVQVDLELNLWKPYTLKTPKRAHWLVTAEKVAVYISPFDDLITLYTYRDNVSISVTRAFLARN